MCILTVTVAGRGIEMTLLLEQAFNYHGQSVAWGCIGEGEPLVMIHGFPWSSQSWRNVAPWLARKRRVFYFDMLGCGQSEKRAGQDVAASVQNDLLAELIRYWSLDRPEVIAHDFGGLAALRGYYLNRLRYRKLTLIDAVAVLPSGSPFYRHVREHEAVFSTLPAYAHKALFAAYIQQAAHKALSEEVVELYAQPWLDDVGQPAFYRQISQSSAHCIEEVQSLYAPMDNDVHLIWGEQDSFIPISQGKELATLISPNSFTSVPSAGHLVQEDAPEAIVSTILSS